MPDQNEEQIRKVFAKDVKVGSDVHTVFKAAKKAKVTARSGKVFLSLNLVDKTGELDARVFDNIEAAEGAFTEGDYLLVKGRTIAFHGKPQLVLDTIERLDPGPIEASEFNYVAPPPEAKADRAERAERAERPDRGGDKSGRRHRLLLAALEDERVLDGLDAFFKHLDAYIEDRVSAKLQSALAKERGQGGGKPKEHRERDRDNHREHKPKVEHKAGESKAEPARDPRLPKELSFKPFSMLAPAPAEQKAEEDSSKPESGS
ncbi:MAG: OB-fold nucleic acid binding domain-containing protein [Myxococcaceae bacterium]